MIYEVQLEGCDDFYIKKTARHCGVRFVEHVAVDSSVQATPWISLPPRSL